MEVHRGLAGRRRASLRRRAAGPWAEPAITEVHWQTHRRERSALDHRAAEQTRLEIEAAIMLVAGGHFPRVVISNLFDGPRAVRDMRGLAEAAGVDLEPLARADGHGCDVAVSAR
jgi:hypothetical protein